MAVPKRHKSVPGTYFVTSRTWESRAIFKTAPSCEIFVESLEHYRDQGAYQLHEFVLMPDHFHLLLTPGVDVALERAVQFIKGGSAKAIRDRLSFRFPVWQRGFSDHRIRDLADYESHVLYIAQNPVKRRLTTKPDEYPWSSACRTFPVDDVPQGLKPRRKPGESARLKPCPDENLRG
jgi:putative transposase